MTVQTVVMVFATIALILTLVERVRRVLAGRPSRLDQPVVFFAVVFGLILILRWPVIFFPQKINPDEAQMLAQAMRYRIHPVPWRDVDGTTSGPLNSMLLNVPLLLGAPAFWPTARMVLWAANCLTLIFLYLALRVFGTRPESQFALIPAILFYAFAVDPNFTHYSSETLPVLLLSAGIYLLARQWNAEQPPRRDLFLLGLIGGSLPLAKLQAAPLGLFLIAVASIRIFAVRRRRRRPAEGRWSRAAVLYSGMAVPGVLILGWVCAKGAISDFWISYVLASSAYAQELSGADRFGNILTLFTSESDFRPYLLSVILTAGAVLGAFYARNVNPVGRLFWPLLISMCGGLLAGLCLFIAGKGFLHYLLLLVPMLAVFQGLVLLSGRELMGTVPADRLMRWALVAAALVFLPQALEPVQYIRHVGTDYPNQKSPQEYAVTKHIGAAARPGDTMSVWGWMPSYYVDTGIAPATRDAIGHYVVSDGPYQEYFRQRYLADLERSRPAFFVDAVSDGTLLWPGWRLTNAHEGFPELDAYIKDNYDLWWSVHVIDGNTPVRIYLLKSRMIELHLSPNNVETYDALTAAGRAR